MLGATTSTAIVIILGLGLIALAAAVWLIITMQRSKRRQDRLSRGFERAQKASKTGSGIQGKPYSVYGEPSWTDKINKSR